MACASINITSQSKQVKTRRNRLNYLEHSKHFQGVLKLCRIRDVRIERSRNVASLALHFYFVSLAFALDFSSRIQDNTRISRRAGNQLITQPCATRRLRIVATNSSGTVAARAPWKSTPNEITNRERIGRVEVIVTVAHNVYPERLEQPTFD